MNDQKRDPKHDEQAHRVYASVIDQISGMSVYDVATVLAIAAETVGCAREVNAVHCIRTGDGCEECKRALREAMQRMVQRTSPSMVTVVPTTEVN